MAKTYRDIDKGTILIRGALVALDPDKEPKLMYYWQRLDENGTQVDGSGPLRNSVEDVKALVKDLKKRFPDDDIQAPPEE